MEMKMFIDRHKNEEKRPIYSFKKPKQSSICIYVNKLNSINCQTRYTVMET